MQMYTSYVQRAVYVHMTVIKRLHPTQQFKLFIIVSTHFDGIIVILQ